jgi:hypothetical protein
VSALRELLATFRIGVEDKELDKAEGKIQGFLGKLKEVGETVAEAFAVEKIKEFVETQVEAATQLERTAIRIGTTTDELQAMQLAASESGVAADSLTNGLRFLNLHIAEAGKGGGEAAQLFKEAGISIKDAAGKSRPAGDVLADLADHIASINDPAKQTQIAMRLLGRGGVELVPLLKKGSEAFREATKDVKELGGGISEAFIGQAKEAEERQAKLTFALTSLKTQIASALLPVVEKVVGWFQRLTAGTIEVTKKTGALSSAMQFFGAVAAYKALQQVSKLATEFGLMKGNILQSVWAMLKFAAPLLIIGLLYLAFDELKTLLASGDTLIGDALGPEKTKFVNELRGAIDQLQTAFSTLDDVLGDSGGIMGVFRNVVVGTATDVAHLLELVVKLVGAVEDAAEGFGDLAHGNFRRAWADFKGDHDARDKLDKEDETDQANEARVTTDQYKADNSTKRQREIFEAIVARKAAIARGDKPPPESAFTSVPGDSAFVGPKNAAVLPSGFVGAPTKDEKQVSIQQTNNTTVTVQTSSDQPKAVGDAVGQGVATAHQRDNARAYTAVRQP